MRSLIFIGLGVVALALVTACSTRIASPYDSISDDLLTQAYLNLAEIERANKKSPGECVEGAEVLEFERTAVLVKVLIARYQSRTGFTDAVTDLKRLENLVSPDFMKTKLQAKVCSPNYWKEIADIIGRILAAEQDERSSRFDLFFGLADLVAKK